MWILGLRAYTSSSSTCMKQMQSRHHIYTNSGKHNQSIPILSHACMNYYSYCLFFMCPLHVSISIVPTHLSSRQIERGAPIFGEYDYFWKSWNRYGVVVSVTLSSGSVVCYVSDKHQTPSSLPGYANWTFTTYGEYQEYVFRPATSIQSYSIVSIACLGQSISNRYTIQADSGRVTTRG